MATSNGTNDSELQVSDGAQRAIQTAIDTLTPHQSEPRVAALIGKLGGIANADGFSEGEAAVTKAMIETHRLRKAETVPQELREQADAAHRALQLEHLGASNPRAAAAYEKARAA